ncbi:MAG: SDR family oxidoreductase [Chloroflexi bacterium]|nr:SDR family oxidoreductase [Chloroflexota bacterium]
MLRRRRVRESRVSRQARCGRKKTALITGASSGIGKATALYLAGLGYRVIGTSRSIGRLDALMSECEGNGRKFIPLELDVNSNDAVSRVLPDVVREHGPIDALVNNAGYGLWGPVETLTIDELKQQFETNFFAAVRMIQALVPDMVERRAGIVINISSVLGRLGTPFNGAYVASKFALEGISESLRTELSPFGVRVALVEPGLFRTEFQSNMVRGANAESPDISYAPYIEKYNRRHDRFQRFGGDPIKVARLIHKIIESDNPPFRNPIGMDARMGILGTRLLPENIYWPLMTKATLR